MTITRYDLAIEKIKRQPFFEKKMSLDDQILMLSIKGKQILKNMENEQRKMGLT